MGRLIIVRHGNTFDRGDTILRVGARTDLPLSQSGLQQAKALADLFSGQTFAAVLCGPLRRQTETARAILGGLSAPSALSLEPGLTEVDYGPDEGQPETAVITRIGAAALRRWDTDRIAHPDWDIDETALSELWAALLSRAAKADLLVVTSNGTARYLFDHVERGAQPLKLRTGAYGVVEIGPNGPILIDWDCRPTT